MSAVRDGIVAVAAMVLGMLALLFAARELLGVVGGLRLFELPADAWRVGVYVLRATGYAGVVALLARGRSTAGALLGAGLVLVAVGWGLAEQAWYGFAFTRLERAAYGLALGAAVVLVLGPAPTASPSPGRAP